MHDMLCRAGHCARVIECWVYMHSDRQFAKYVPDIKVRLCMARAC